MANPTWVVPAVRLRFWGGAEKRASTLLTCTIDDLLSLGIQGFRKPACSVTYLADERGADTRNSSATQWHGPAAYHQKLECHVRSQWEYESLPLARPSNSNRTEYSVHMQVREDTNCSDCAQQASWPKSQCNLTMASGNWGSAKCKSSNLRPHSHSNFTPRFHNHHSLLSPAARGANMTIHDVSNTRMRTKRTLSSHAYDASKRKIHVPHTRLRLLCQPRLSPLSDSAIIENGLEDRFRMPSPSRAIMSTIEGGARGHDGKQGKKQPWQPHSPCSPRGTRGWPRNHTQPGNPQSSNPSTEQRPKAR
ncbi:predicted protein [Plenodomus lingam JN3]|uniref:Predicted protein n=2 Tax=Leptosphaeria maculans TaxID=5022 RepID=E5A0Y0_LEPMJ|nr:predicted protein [Plenodomus lingam JN3]CBX97276.1 predicted protein [Plenodomus lingam JN3]